VSRQWFYVLDNESNPVKTQNIEEWCEWFSTHQTQIGCDTVRDVTISTVFLGIDHNYSGVGDPLLFETMIFPPHSIDRRIMRCTTHRDAVALHEAAVRAVTSWPKTSKEKL